MVLIVWWSIFGVFGIVLRGWGIFVGVVVGFGNRDVIVGDIVGDSDVVVVDWIKLVGG